MFLYYVFILKLFNNNFYYKMNRSIFHCVFIVLFIIFNFHPIFCVSSNSFMSYGYLNNRDYFFYGNIQQILLQSDLCYLFNNFDQVSFEVVKYINLYETNYSKNYNNDPKIHYNLILNFKESLNYYHSFVFSHHEYNNYYEYLYNIDLNGKNKSQFWKPYLHIHNKNWVEVKIQKTNINPNNYMINTDLKYKIYNIIKMYVNRK